ncbi:MAG: glycosyltransferase family 2 protein, partial [Clostridia bacterium]|nr:glycosyltransferase family 2 protein [Clostridia bacterium]
MSLSVCLIVKDEQEVLARCLSCAKKFADEIVVVDTGSTDDTVKIAKSFTDKVFFFKWCDDFSAARNFAFEKAGCDLVMWLDADDII